MRLVSAVALTAVLATTAHGFCPSSLLPAQTPRAGVLAGRAPRAARRFAPRAALEVIDSSYNLALGSLALGGLFGVPGSPLKSKVGAFAAGEPARPPALAYPGHFRHVFLSSSRKRRPPTGIPLALFGLFIAFQTTNLRFTFDDTQFALVKVSESRASVHLHTHA